MKNVARGSVLLFLVALFSGVFYFQPKVEAVTFLASDSQENFQKFNNKEILDDNIEKIAFNVEIEESAEAAALEAASFESSARAFKATAYCLRGRTASGRKVRRGIVAADPRVLRLGSRIKMSAGKYSGNYMVADTGGRIKGRVLDIWVPSCKEARKWGRRTVHVKVLSKGKYKKKRRR